jgi:uncharacterized coiled-coil protein SlyX
MALLALLGSLGALLVLEFRARLGLEERLAAFEERLAVTERASRGLTQRLEALRARLENRRVVDESFATRLRDLRGQISVQESSNKVEPLADAKRVDQLSAGLAALGREVEALAEAVDALTAQQSAVPDEPEADGASSEPAEATFSPDGRQVMTTDGKTVRIWDAESGEEITPAPETEE